MGRRTVSRVLWAAFPLAVGHPSSYHRFFSAARWSMRTLARVHAAIVLELVPPEEAVFAAVDDTVTPHRGRKVHGKGWHRDAVRSSRQRTMMMLGHKWVVLTVNVRLPWCRRPWALPVLAALYVPRAERRSTSRGQVRKIAGDDGAASHLPVLRRRDKHGVLTPRHKTPCLLARQMLAAMIHWFPQRKFILTGDSGFASHALAWFCHRHRRHVTLVARFPSDASLHALARPPEKPRPGRRRTKGVKLPSPRQMVQKATHPRQARVAWYGQSQRDVELLGGCAGWYRCRGSGRGALVPVRWVYCRELVKGDEGFFYSTDPAVTGERIVTWFAARWNIEVTFQEVRAHLGMHTPRQRCRQSVLRTAPLLMGLFSVVSGEW